MAEIDFDQILLAGNWQPIRNCPGRYALRGEDRNLGIDAIAGQEIKVSTHRSEAAADEILVAAFTGGGMISYRRADGSFLHTLNDEEGFERKLRQLGIEVGLS